MDERHDGSFEGPCLSPLHGDEPNLGKRLRGFFEQRYEGKVHMVCGVRDHDDRAVGHVREMQDEREYSVDLNVSGHDHGPNRKISNFANMLRLAKHDVLVISDSDIEVSQNYLSQLVAHLNEENIGAVTCLYHGLPYGNIWSRHEALAINSHFLPNVIVAMTFDFANPCCGSTIALKRRTLEAIGGFERFARHLADDHEIGKAVRLAGYHVAIPGFTVGHQCFSDSFKSLLSHETRVARTVRCIDPLGYLGSVITHPFPLALAGVYSFDLDAIPLAVFALGLRGLLCVDVERALSLPHQACLLLPFGDAISFLSYCAGFGAPKISWRGLKFKVTREGEMTPVQ
ncbi:MAG: bacteriohopanetetrol glucosamine biosynthesis glycosyltransferase HpnI [Methylocystis sp.]|uniref:bacteriohopanetetrol glucosamine biosynthesis glycosyltransferase HpnI n=1 Tax=Methylocystis sp. TaxID=1911079 RepID=UPI003DA27599